MLFSFNHTQTDYIEKLPPYFYLKQKSNFHICAKEQVFFANLSYSLK